MAIEEKMNQCFLSARNGEIYRLVIDDTEKMLIEKALEYAEGNQLSASRLLGLNRNTLRTKIKKLNIDPGRYKK
jgi:DNA-binding protein Fis